MDAGLFERKISHVVAPFNVNTEANVFGYSLVVYVHEAAEKDRCSKRFRSQNVLLRTSLELLNMSWGFSLLRQVSQFKLQYESGTDGSKKTAHIEHPTPNGMKVNLEETQYMKNLLRRLGNEPDLQLIKAVDLGELTRQAGGDVVERCVNKRII